MRMLKFVLPVALSISITAGAMAQEAQEPTPTPQPVVQPQTASSLVPIDPRLQQIVKLVQAGLSESLIAESIKKETVPYKLTPQDLLYLKENRVPESIIAALLGVEAPSSTEAGRQMAAPEVTPTPEPPTETVIEGLVLKTGLFRRNAPGSIVFLQDKIEWRDAGDASGNITIYPAGVKKVELKCRTQATGLFCYELEIDINEGDSFKFEDAEQAVGGNRAILALRDALKEKYPRIPILEKVKR